MIRFPSRGDNVDEWERLAARFEKCVKSCDEFARSIPRSGELAPYGSSQYQDVQNEVQTKLDMLFQLREWLDQRSGYCTANARSLRTKAENAARKAQKQAGPR